jgi:hypothetical protein
MQQMSSRAFEQRHEPTVRHTAHKNAYERSAVDDAIAAGLFRMRWHRHGGGVRTVRRAWKSRTALLVFSRSKYT